MKRSQILLGTLALACTVASCDGLKEAFTAHVDQVARAQGQELSTERLASLVGNSQIPARRDVAAVVADFWVSYQLIGYAGAHSDGKPDSLSDNWWVKDTKAIDQAMWASILTSRAQKFYESVAKTFAEPDTTGLEQKYSQANSFAAQHILIAMPQNGQGMSEKMQDSIRKKAEGIRAKVTAANFADMAKQHSMDPGSKDAGGTYAMFAAGAMVPEFEAAVRALKPGEISALVKTSHGYHIIRRHTLAEVRSQFIESLRQSHNTESANKYIEKLRADWKVTFKPDAPALIKEVAKSPESHRGDKKTIATSRLGDFTAARLAQWISVIPPQAQIRERLTQSPDSLVTKLVGSLIDQEIIGAEAEKVNIGPDTAELKQIRGYFASMVGNAMAGLGVDPASLGDSAKTTAEKERLAATRVEEALDRLFATNGQSMVDIPPQLAEAMRNKYSSRVNGAGLDRAVERAMSIRAAADSARAKGAPPGTVPPPGVQPQPDLPPGAIPVPVPPGARPGKQR